MRQEKKDLVASTEMIIAAAAFTLGGVAFITIEGWMGTTALILGALAAVGTLWAARWNLLPETSKGRHWEELPEDRKDREADVTAEIVIGASAFLLGSVAYMAMEGALGLTMFLLGGATALGALWVAHHEGGFRTD